MTELTPESKNLIREYINTEDQLRSSQKLLIRDYMVKVVALPAVALAFVSAMFGFFINRASELEAEKRANVMITELESKLAKSKSELDIQISDLSSSIEKRRKTIANIDKETENLGLNLKSFKSNLDAMTVETNSTMETLKGLENNLESFLKDNKPEDVAAFLDLFSSKSDEFDLAASLAKIKSENAKIAERIPYTCLLYTSPSPRD